MQGSAVLLGLADEPDRQRQPVVSAGSADRALLVVGGPGSGVSNTLDLVEAQVSARIGEGDQNLLVRVPGDPEAMWDVMASLHEQMPPAGSVVLIDDLDAVALRVPPDYAHAVFERVEGVLRRAGDAGVFVVAGAHRLTGAVARVAELFPRRLVLPYASRIDHVAAGGDSSAHDPSAPAGRARLEHRAVQVALAPSVVRDPAIPHDAWMPRATLTGMVARRSPAGRRALAAWSADGARVLGLDEYASDPSSAAAGRLVLTGEPDEWQRHWRLLADVRGDHDLVVDTSCAAELRVLGGFRGVPPYCEPGRGRAWLLAAGADPVRIVLPDSDVRPNRQGAASTGPRRAT